MILWSFSLNAAGPEATYTEKCNHEEESSGSKVKWPSWRTRTKNLLETNDALQAQNFALHEKFEELFTELSLKEAQWCEKEEQLNLKVSKSSSEIL